MRHSFAQSIDGLRRKWQYDVAQMDAEIENSISFAIHFQGKSNFCFHTKCCRKITKIFDILHIRFTVELSL